MRAKCVYPISLLVSALLLLVLLLRILNRTYSPRCECLDELYAVPNDIAFPEPHSEEESRTSKRRIRRFVDSLNSLDELTNSTEAQLENSKPNAERDALLTTSTSNIIKDEERVDDDIGSQLQNGNSSNGTHPWLRPFNYTILPRHICNPLQKVLFVMNMAIPHFAKRRAIRDTYANKKWFDKYNIRTLFAVGVSYNPEEQTALEKEAEFHGDILQIDFHDAYRNLTIKDVNWMRYVQDYCPDLELVVMMCDDMMPNVFRLMEDFYDKKISTNGTFTCVMYYGNPIRDNNSPWYVSFEAYPESQFPIYCSGAAYMISADLLPILLEEVDVYEQYIPIEDVFLTGIIGHRVNATYDFDTYRWSKAEDTEREMVSKRAVIGAYKSVDQLRRIYKELVYLYGIEQDTPDQSKEPNKSADFVARF